MTERWTGLVAATFSPLKANGDIDPDRIGRVVERLLDEGVSGLFVCGTTGEGASLATDERMEIARAYVAASAGRLPVMVHVGKEPLRDAQVLAEHAASIRATAIGFAPPTYFKPAGVERIVDCLGEVAAAAPDLPLYYYHIPKLTGVHADAVGLLERGTERVPSFAGIKYSEPTVDEYQRCVEWNGGAADVLFGCDEMLLSGLAAGGRAAVGSTYNFAAPLYRRVIDAFDRGDLGAARRWQSRSVRMIDVLIRHGALPAFKTTMGLVGVPCGPCRLPVATLDAEAREELRRELESIGFFKWGRPEDADSAA